MAELTKEWLQNMITGIESVIDDKSFVCDEIVFKIGEVKNILTAFKVALASLEAEPIAWECGENIILFNPDTVEAYAKPAEITPKPLFTATPVPLTPEGLIKAVRFYEQVKRENPPAETGAWKDAVDWVLKEACHIKGGE
ncbi:putative prophage protein [Escherichia coli]|uniref:hypothetical protein n=1 Tax=Escherichia coli TaxID=562 RepID=UPI000BE1C24E|nr:hypothetical protein [Escherichia coli]UMT13230.1 hypothetical protein AOY61_10810 [Escherichia coli]CAD5615306.1 putative prophage protein [Escherichia coli]CAD5865782.1 putative prophage protein [Escherichia coli]CAD6094794.1 putative prophage protein [Escherichia coli]